jgi:hypothetical protein
MPLPVFIACFRIHKTMSRRQHFIETTPLRRWFPPALFCCVAALAPAVSAQRLTPDEALDQLLGVEPPASDNDWTRHFRLGMVVGLNISAQFRMSGTFAVSGSGTSGVYDDGYMLRDDTGDAGGYTSYWGYDSASQYDPTTHTLTMHSAKSFTTSGGGSSDDSPYLGFDLAYGDSDWNWGNAKIGWELGFDLLPVHIGYNQPLSASVTRSAYGFDTGGIVLPTAPYNGGSSGTGPTIHDTPTPLADEVFPSGTVTGTHSLDVTLYSVRLGPAIYWDLTQSLGLYASAGPVVGIVSGDLEWDENIAAGGTVAHNRGQIGSTEAVFGGYVNATLVYHAVANGDIYLGAQYMPLTGVAFNGAGREARLNLDGQIYISAGINWTF